MPAQPKGSGKADASATKIEWPEHLDPLAYRVKQMEAMPGFIGASTPPTNAGFKDGKVRSEYQKFYTGPKGKLPIIHVTQHPDHDEAGETEAPDLVVPKKARTQFDRLPLTGVPEGRALPVRGESQNPPVREKSIP